MLYRPPCERAPHEPPMYWNPALCACRQGARKDRDSRSQGRRQGAEDVYGLVVGAQVSVAHNASLLGALQVQKARWGCRRCGSDFYAGGRSASTGCGCGKHWNVRKAVSLRLSHACWEKLRGAGDTRGDICAAGWEPWSPGEQPCRRQQAVCKHVTVTRR